MAYVVTLEFADDRCQLHTDRGTRQARCFGTCHEGTLGPFGEPGFGGTGYEDAKQWGDQRLGERSRKFPHLFIRNFTVRLLESPENIWLTT